MKAKKKIRNGDTSHVTPNPIALTNKVIKVLYVPSFVLIFFFFFFCGGVYLKVHKDTSCYNCLSLDTSDWRENTYYKQVVYNVQ